MRERGRVGWPRRRNPETAELTLWAVPIGERGSWGLDTWHPQSLVRAYIFPSAKEGSDSWPQCLPLAVNAYGEPLGSEFLMGFEGGPGQSVNSTAGLRTPCMPGTAAQRGGIAPPGALS